MDKTLVKGLMLYELLARSDRPRGVTEISQALELTKSNVHRLLQTMMSCGYVEQDADSGRYTATFKGWEIGYEVWTRSALKRASTPFAEDLARRTGQTAHIAIVAGDDLLFFEQIGAPGPYPFRRFWPIGGRVPCWELMSGGHDLIAMQVACIAALPEPDRKRILKSIAGKSKRAASVKKLTLRIQETLDQGYAVNRGEWIDHVRGVAASFMHPDGRLAGVLGLTAEAAEVKGDALERWGKATSQSARGISHALGSGQHGGQNAGQHGR